MAHKKLLIRSSIVYIAIWFIYLLTKWILRMNRLWLRNIPQYTIYSIIVCFTLFLILQIIFYLFQLRKTKKKRLLRTITTIGIIVLILSTLFFSFVLTIISIFKHEPEHVVEKNGKQMVAYVDSFLQVNVYYYDYKNAFVHGGMRAREDYGNGGYDPFDRNEMPNVKHYTYYDDDGNITDSL